MTSLPAARKMSSRATGLALAGLWLIAGCQSSIPMSATKPAQLPVATAQGIPTRFHANVGAGYWLGIDENGTWHLRVTSGTISLRFQGRIHPLGGATLKELELEGVINGRRRNTNGASMEDGDIVFVFEGVNHGPGFRFRVNGDAALECDFRINGDGDAAKIFIGTNNVVPPSAHFILRPANTSLAPAKPVRATPERASPPPSTPAPPITAAEPPTPNPSGSINTLAELSARLRQWRTEFDRFFRTHRAISIDFRTLEETVSRLATPEGRRDSVLRTRYDETLAHTLALAVEISARDNQREEAQEKARQLAARLKELPTAAALPSAP